MQHFDWDIMLFNFNEAWEELEIMLDRAAQQPMRAKYDIIGA